MADCRRCAFYVWKDMLSESEYRVAERMAAQRGGVLLGWCRARSGPVTYYTGRCRFYRERERRVLPLSHYFRQGGSVTGDSNTSAARGGS